VPELLPFSWRLFGDHCPATLTGLGSFVRTYAGLQKSRTSGMGTDICEDTCNAVLIRLSGRWTVNGGSLTFEAEATTLTFLQPTIALAVGVWDSVKFLGPSHVLRLRVGGQTLSTGFRV
jgi:hypothetical protein